MKMNRQDGFGYIAAVVIVVALAMLGVAAARLYTTQQTGASQDILSQRAWQAARAGTEWGLYQALRLGNCGAAPVTLNLRAQNGFSVTVTCTAFPFNEGEVLNAPGVSLAKTVFTIDAVACNSNACPDNAGAAGLEYVERRRVVSACGVNGPAPLAAC